MRFSLSLLALASACTQTPTKENPLQLVVGPDGGNVTSEELKMEVPAGAVDSEVTLTAYPTDRAISGVKTASQTWTFGPEGQAFKTPITVSMAFTRSHDNATLWWTKAGDLTTFSNLKTSAKDGWAAGSVAHFSEGAVGDDDQCGADENDTGDQADSGEEVDSGDEADVEGQHGHQDEADGEHGDHEEDGKCEHDDHEGEGGDEGEDGGDDANDGEADD